MNILYVTTEATPFASSGGLGDVMGSLPKAVHDKGNRTQVILPLYKTMNECARGRLSHIRDISFRLGWRNTGFSLYGLKEDGVEYLFVENSYYFDRPNLYGEYDDGERFAFFSMAVIEYILSSGDIPDILHANDWQCSLSIVYLKTLYKDNKALGGIRTVYTLHNVEYQGKYDPYILGDVFGLDEKYKDILLLDGSLNLMKGGILTADFVTTVSPTYANELSYDFFAFGLSGVIKANRDKMVGIINGIDYSVHSPTNAKGLYKAYSRENFKEGKLENKKRLLSELGMRDEDGRPLIVMVTRLASQKGIDLVLHILDELLSEKINFVILGTGESCYERSLIEKDFKYENFKALIRFDRSLSAKLYAASDIFLMPSKSEPCGLAQMIACSYGAIPVVRSVGGLCDTIIPIGQDEANGFRFDNYNAHELLYSVKEAVSLYGSAEEWDKLVESAMKSRFTWDKSAEEYIRIYRKITD